MIPKTIHYCWFGRNSKPKLVKKCIQSWQNVCRDYQIVEWNESNFDLDRHPYLRWCHERSKWAFLSDFSRLLIVYEHGGLYFDTDVELIRNPDHLLNYEAFFGFENNNSVATGLGFGSVAGHPTLEAMIAYYEKLAIGKDGNYPVRGCPIINTEALIPLGLKRDGSMQNVAGAIILPPDYLNPYNDATGCLNKTAHTISIHWYGKSWMSKRAILRSRLTRPFHRLFGVHCFDWLKK